MNSATAKAYWKYALAPACHQLYRLKSGFSIKNMHMNMPVYANNTLTSRNFSFWNITMKLLSKLIIYLQLSPKVANRSLTLKNTRNTAIISKQLCGLKNT